MGLTDDKLWGLSRREYDALTEQWKGARDHQSALIAALRADLHNTAGGPNGRLFDRLFTPEEFLAGHVDGIEEKARKLIAQGYTPSEAASLASSKQTGKQKLHIVGKACDVAHDNKHKGTRRVG